MTDSIGDLLAQTGGDAASSQTDVISAAQLSAFGWNDPDTWAERFSAAFANVGIETGREVAHLLTQLAVESGMGKSLVENLNYSAETLMRLWPKRFPSLSLAKTFAGNPQKIANQVYANRMGNGAPESGDGYRYRGRGLIQITGKDNYLQSSGWVRLDLSAQPDQAAEPDLAAEIAVQWWRAHGAESILRQTPKDTDACTALRKMINGGTNGLDHALELLPKALKIFA